jgi:DNA-binding winged helix-turn-helix (wHTH) protein
MRMERKSETSLRFAGLTLDLARLSLDGQDKQIYLRPKSFDVLRYLAENAGRIVPKDELIGKVWCGAFVTDDSLVQCINEVRTATGDRDRQIIKTIPRRGYFFAAPVIKAGTTAAIECGATPRRLSYSAQASSPTSRLCGPSRPRPNF